MDQVTPSQECVLKQEPWSVEGGEGVCHSNSSSEEETAVLEPMASSHPTEYREAAASVARTRLPRPFHSSHVS